MIRTPQEPVEPPTPPLRLDDPTLPFRSDLAAGPGHGAPRRPKTHRERLQDVIDQQCADGNWNYDAYMMGLANGLILAAAIMDDGGELEPLLKTRPAKGFIKDNVPTLHEVIAGRSALLVERHPTEFVIVPPLSSDDVTIKPVEEPDVQL